MPILSPPKVDLERTPSDPGLEYLESQRHWSHNWEPAARKARLFIEDHDKQPEKYPRAKTYPLAETKRLEPRFERLNRSLGATLARRRTTREFSSEPMNFEDVSTLLAASFGRQSALPGSNPVREWQRTIPSPGGLFASEIYYFSLATPGLGPGLYHFQPEALVLEHLPPPMEEIDPEKLLIASPGSCKNASGILLVTSVFDRLRKKYGHRYLRFAYLEAGAICQNLDLVAAALDLGLWHQGAVDELSARRLLRIDGVTEAVTYAAVIGKRET
jgi:SagB-type dehydrogenase family enzyme